MVTCSCFLLVVVFAAMATYDVIDARFTDTNAEYGKCRYIIMLMDSVKVFFERYHEGCSWKENRDQGYIHAISVII